MTNRATERSTHGNAVGAEIRRIRKERRMSQAQFAVPTNLTYSSISQYECGTGRPTIVTLAGIADGLALGNRDRLRLLLALARDLGFSIDLTGQP